MKKEYEAPKAEKMEFDYEENVVASGSTGGGSTEGITANNYVGQGGGWASPNGSDKKNCVKIKKC